MKKLAGFVAMILAAALTLTSCGVKGENNSAEVDISQQQETEHEEIKDLVIYKSSSGELSTFNILYSQSGSDFSQLTNLVDPLLEINSKNQIVPCIAEEYGIEDNGLTWTFKIRKGVQWMDMNGNEKAELTARDFLTGFE